MADKPIYTVNCHHGSDFAIHDTRCSQDIAHVGRRSQAAAIVDGLNEGTLAVDKHGKIVEVSR